MRVGHVFISYNSNDSACALSIYNYLKACGASCWIAPKDATVGCDYGEEVTERIKTCDHFVLLVSEYSQKSDHVLNELDLAFKYRRKIIPILLDDTPVSPSFEYRITSKQWLKYYQDVDKVRAVLADAICPPESLVAIPGIGDGAQPGERNIGLSELNTGTTQSEISNQLQKSGCFWGIVWALRAGIAFLALSVIYVIYYFATGDTQQAETGLQASAIVAGYLSLCIFVTALYMESDGRSNIDKEPQTLKRMILRLIKYIFVGFK